MITVMTGQVVDIFDRDFREMYAISEKLDLYKEFHVSPPAANNTSATVCSKAGPKRPPLPATTSRFQVSLGDSRKANIQVPAHKYNNPKYSLVFGDSPRPTGSLQGLGHQKGSLLAELPEEAQQGRPRLASSERMGQPSPLPSEATSDSLKRPNGFTQDKKAQLTWTQKMFKKKSSTKHPPTSPADSTCATPTRTGENEDNLDVIVRTPSKWRMKKSSKLSQTTDSEQTVTTAQDNESKANDFTQINFLLVKYFITCRCYVYRLLFFFCFTQVLRVGGKRKTSVTYPEVNLLSSDDRKPPRRLNTDYTVNVLNTNSTCDLCNIEFLPSALQREKTNRVQTQYV